MPDIYTQPMFFMGYTTKAGGHLPDLPEAHALFYYYLMARRQFEEIEQGFEIQYDLGQESSGVDYYQIATSIAWVYGVKLYEMIRYWRAVDEQCLLLGLPLLPHGEKYRLNGPNEGKHRRILTTS